MNQDCGRNVGASAAGLMQAEHLEASRNGEKKDRRREEHANVVVREAYGFEVGREGHSVGLTAHQGLSQAQWQN